MPVENGMGFGEHTALKQEHFEKIVQLHMRITTGVQGNWKERRWTGPDLDTYYYFDINAGAGNDPTGLVGSPLLFLRQARGLDLRYKAVLIEREIVNAQRLSSLIDDADVTIECGDHNVCLPRYFVNDRQRFGLLYTDPSGSIPPFDLLAQMSRQNIYKRLDMCIYVHATNIKRIRRSPDTSEQRCLRDFMATIDKKFWIVREPIGNEQWTFLIGSNWESYPDWKKEGFHKWNSPIGMEILDKLTYTPQELSAKRGQLTFDFFSGPNLATSYTETTPSI